MEYKCLNCNFVSHSLKGISIHIGRLHKDKNICECIDINSEKLKKIFKELVIKSLEKYIKNVNKNIYEKIIKLSFEYIEKINSLNENKISRFISKNILRINGCFGQQTKKYWLSRGWNEEEIKQKIKKIVNRPPSPFTDEYWIKKGYSKEEAYFKIREQRKSSIYYWIKKGYSKEEAQKKVIEFSKQANILYNNRTTKEERLNKYKHSSPRCKEYWIKLGYSEDEAKEKVSEIQITFSKEKCINKYGNEEGLKIWQDRQNRWQTTLNSKSKEEINEINKKKINVKLSSFVRRFGNKEGKRKYLKFCLRKNIQIFKNVKDLIKYIDELRKNIFVSSLSLNCFIEKRYIRKDCYIYLGVNEKFFLETQFDWNKNNKIFINIIQGRGFNRLYKLYTEDGKLLRSSLEINFYCKLLENNIKNFDINKNYPNSKLFYDFYLKDFKIYIEIAGRLADEDYRQNMLFKQNTFASIILKNINEFDEFIKGLKDGNIEKFVNRNL